MDIPSIRQYITDTFINTHSVEADSDTFFLYGSDDKFPFATIVTKDNDFDNVSNLNRPGVFRLNIGVGKQTFQSLFDLKAVRAGADDPANSGFDYTVLDKIIPHPTYGRMYWISILNPSTETFRSMHPLLTEAYDLTVKRETKDQ